MRLLSAIGDYFKAVIELCNHNEGFISAILAIVAIIISVRIGRIPYQKKLWFYHYNDSNEEREITTVVYVSNIGQCPVYIDELFAKEGFCKRIGICEDLAMSALVDTGLLGPQQAYWFKIPLDGYFCDDDRKRKPLRIIVKSGRKVFRYKADWAMG